MTLRPPWAITAARFTAMVDFPSDGPALVTNKCPDWFVDAGEIQVGAQGTEGFSDR